MNEIIQQKTEVIDETKIPLRRVLGVVTAILMVSGNMIGTGVFKKVVPMAQTGLSETWILMAWAVAGIIVTFGAFTFAGLSRLTTESGGAYEYLRVSLGGFIAFLSGWALFIIIGSGSIAAIAFIFSQSVNALVTIPNPLHNWQTISIAHSIYPFDSFGIKLFSVGTIILLTWFNVRGVKNSGFLNNVVTTAKILGILFLILAGIILSSPTSINGSVIPANTLLSHSSFFSVFLGALLSAFWAYDGFTNITSIAGEIKNSKRNIPIAIITAVTIVMVLYLLINYAFMRVMNLNQLASLGDNKIAASEVAGRILGAKGTMLISVLIMLSSFGTLNIIILFYSRVYFRMAQENVFFKSASKVHPIYRTPYNALWYSMIWCCILTLSGTFDVLTNMVIFTGFLFYMLNAIGLIKLKRRKIIEGKIPGYPLAPILFILFTTIFLAGILISNAAQSLAGTGLVLTGVPFYYFFKRKKRI